MKTLKTIQTLSKIGKIVSKVVYICCIVGFSGCIFGIIALAVGADVVKIGGVTLDVLLKREADVSLSTLYTVIASAMPLCAGGAALAKIAERYFSHELKDGTPFSAEGAKELLMLGIWIIVIPLCSVVVANIVQEIMAAVMTDVVKTKLEGWTSVGLGIAFIVMAIMCRYGYELSSKSDDKTEVDDKDEDDLNDDNDVKND